MKNNKVLIGILLGIIVILIMVIILFFTNVINFSANDVNDNQNVNNMLENDDVDKIKALTLAEEYAYWYVNTLVPLENEELFNERLNKLSEIDTYSVLDTYYTLGINGVGTSAQKEKKYFTIDENNKFKETTEYSGNMYIDIDKIELDKFSFIMSGNDSYTNYEKYTERDNYGFFKLDDNTYSLRWYAAGGGNKTKIISFQYGDIKNDEVNILYYIYSDYDVTNVKFKFILCKLKYSETKKLYYVDSFKSSDTKIYS